MLFNWPKLLYPFFSSIIFPFPFFCLQVGIVGLGHWADRVQLTVSKPCSADLLLIMIIVYTLSYHFQIDVLVQYIKSVYFDGTLETTNSQAMKEAFVNQKKGKVGSMFATKEKNVYASDQILFILYLCDGLKLWKLNLFSNNNSCWYLLIASNLKLFISNTQFFIREKPQSNLMCF